MNIPNFRKPIRVIRAAELAFRLCELRHEILQPFTPLQHGGFKTARAGDAYTTKFLADQNSGTVQENG